MRLLTAKQASAVLSVSTWSFKRLRQKYPQQLQPVVVGALVRWTDEQIDQLILALQRDTTTSYSSRGARGKRRAA